MEVVQLPDAAEWLSRAGALLLADEARHNLILGLAGTLRDRPGLYPEHELWLVEDAGEVLAAALRTPPYRLVLAGGDHVALEALAARLGHLPGVVAAVPEATVFADAWRARTGAVIAQGHAQGVYRLECVVPPRRPASGAPRAAADTDRELLLDWLRAFSVEALHERKPDPAQLGRMLEQRMGPEADSGFAVWEDGGEPVSLCGFGSSTPNGSRIGPVYTPPRHRGRGYAGALVAEVSQARLDAGKRFCFLYTDLANPTSNRIYVDVGYERVCDSVELDFV